MCRAERVRLAYKYFSILLSTLPEDAVIAFVASELVIFEQWSVATRRHGLGIIYLLQTQGTPGVYNCLDREHRFKPPLQWKEC